MISILILTRNEQENISQCLRCSSWSNDVVVFDSFSTDRTVELAVAAGARVIQRQFDNYAGQRNAALQTIEYKNPWILILDADERTTPELVQEMRSVVARCQENVTLCRMRRKDMLFDRWLKRSSG